MISDNLRTAIDALHREMSDEHDPKAINVIAGCVARLTALQQTKYEGASGGGGSDPRAALVAQLSGGPA
jgi:hypothetical protein